MSMGLFESATCSDGKISSDAQATKAGGQEGFHGAQGVWD